MNKIKVSIDVLEGAIQTNKQLIWLLETYIKKAGEWSGTMVANMTLVREEIETQEELIKLIQEKANLLDNL